LDFAYSDKKQEAEMASSDAENPDADKRLPRYKLLTFLGLIIVLPLLAVSYIFYENKIPLDLPHIVILALALILILCGLLIFRQIFDKIFVLAALIRRAESEDNHLTDIKRDTSELHEISVSFNNLMKKFEETTDNLRLRVSELFAIKELTEIASKSLDIDYLLNLILEKAMAVTRAQIGSVSIVESEKAPLRIVASRGLECSPEKRSDREIFESLTQYVMSHKKPLLVKDIQTDPRIQRKNDPKYGPPSFLSMPIFAREDLIGVLNLSNKETEQIFDANDEQIVSILTGEIGFALENARLHSKVEENLKNLESRAVELTRANNQLQQEIADRKQAEEDKARLQVKLQRAEKMEAIGTLAGGVAHDLNNLLSGIVSYPDVLLMDLPEDSPLRKPISTIKNTGTKAAAIVEDLLTLGRRGVNTAEVVNLNAIISEFLNSPEFEKLKSLYPDVDVETCLETNLLNILGSPVHLSTTIMNLAFNAAEAMPDGGKISISTDNRYIDRPISGYDDVAEGDYVVLAVTDTGSGLSAEDVKRIFEPFYTKKVMGRSGTGLGMAVVWGTVKDHNGYIDVHNSEEKGTAFTIYFPITRKKLAEEKSMLSANDYMGRGESILVVDDVEEQREIASGMLEKLGYSVVSVSSGEEAVDYMKSHSADLLVLDMIMDPGIDGLETYKRILDLHPGQKAITVSGFSETNNVKEVQRLGASTYLKKPYSLERMGATIRAELDN
jgi:signal transduction histidine kinase